MFSSALNYLKDQKVRWSVLTPDYPTSCRLFQHEHSEPIDEEAVQEHHKQAYQEGSAKSLSAGSMGSAAALQVWHFHRSHAAPDRPVI
jgi:hypothetical protein